MNKNDISEIVFNSIKEINKQLHYKLELDLDEVLLGPNNKLDSINLVRLIVSIEQEMHLSYDIKISIAKASMLTLENNPFGTVKTLIDHIHFVICKNNG